MLRYCPQNRSSYHLLRMVSPSSATNNLALQEKTMKTLKQVCMAAALTLLLGLSAFAGDIQIGAPSPPPPPVASSSSATTAPGDIHIPGYIGTPAVPSDP